MTAGRWLWPAVIILATASVFSPVLQNGFVNWDDPSMVVDNPQYRGLDFDHLKWMWTTWHVGHYQPLAWMTLAVDHAVWGMNPRGYHLTNLLLHVANALLVYALALILLAPGAGPTDARIRVAAAAASLFFALHPLRVEVVAWVTERREVLAAFFFLATVYAHLRAGYADVPGRARWWVISVGACFLSLTAKATAIVMPAVLIVLDMYPLGRIGAAQTTRPSLRASRAWAEKIPFVILSLVFGWVAIHAQKSAGALTTLEQLGLSHRLSQVAFGLVFYIWKTILPFNLSPIYELAPNMKLSSGPYLACAIAVMALTATLVWRARRRPALLAAWLIYVSILSPVLGVAQSGPQLVADRYSYLSCVGIAILIGAQLRSWLCSDRSAALKAWLPAVIGPAILLFLGARAWRQCGVWKDSLTLWQHAVSVQPSSYYANFNLAQACLTDKRFDAAAETFRKMTERWPTEVRVHAGLGASLLERGDLAGAVAALRRAVDVDPRNVVARFQMGRALLQGGRPDLAAAEFETALQLRPDFLDARMQYGKALVALNRANEAVLQYERAIEIRRDFAPAHNSLANELAIQGRLDEAVSHYRTALLIDPGLYQAHNNLGAALAQLGKFDEAIGHYRECLRHDPSYARAHYNMAQALAALGRNDESLSEFEAALRAAPVAGTLRDSILREMEKTKDKTGRF